MDKSIFLPYWKSITNEKKVFSFDVFNYCIFKAMSSKSSDKQQIALNLLEKAFSPITNNVKLANGRTAYDTIARNARMARYCGLRTSAAEIVHYPWYGFLNDPADLELYNEIVAWIRLNWQRAGRHYVYIFVRQDILSPEQIAVQAAHVTLVLGTKLHKKYDPSKLYFTLVGVNSWPELDKARIAVTVTGGKTEFFREPDLSNMVTAVASHPIHHAERGALLEYPLLTIAPVTQLAE